MDPPGRPSAGRSGECGAQRQLEGVNFRLEGVNFKGFAQHADMLARRIRESEPRISRAWRTHDERVMPPPVSNPGENVVHVVPLSQPPPVSAALRAPVATSGLTPLHV